MSNRRYNMDHLRLNVSSILRRLPLHRQLSDSQTFLIKLTPTCQAWFTEHLATDFLTSTLLTAYKDGSLTIACQSSICASQIKHQQTNLLEALHHAGFEDVKRLNICINHPISEQNSSETTIDSQHSFQATSGEPDIERTPASDKTIRNIENCHKSIPNENLAESLKKLAETLKQKD